MQWQKIFNQINLSEPTIQPWEVRGGDDFDRAFAAMGKQRPDGLYAAPRAR
jgi:hypothetical protein